MNLKYKIYTVLKKNPLHPFSADDMCKKLHMLNPSIEKIMIKLAMDYPNIKAKTEKVVKKFYYELEKKDEKIET